MNVVNCPNCGAPIEIDELLERNVRNNLTKELETKHKEELETALENERNKLKELTEETIRLEKDRIREEEKRKIEQLNKDNESKDKINKEMREELLKILDQLKAEKEKSENAELNAKKKLLEETEEIKKKAMESANSEWDLKYREMQKQLNDTKDALETAKKKAEQGSQQNQGEVLELELEECLKTRFSYDQIEEVKKGQRGADVKQVVKDYSEECGLILWETKNAQWQPAWIPKFKQDIREANAIIGILVSVNIPEECGEFGEYEGVWITKPQYALAVADILRSQILGVYRANKTHQNKDAKMEIVYQYITGPEFRHRVEAIIENYSNLKIELDKEKRSTEKRWAKQEKAIESVIKNTAGMYGDFQGMIGNALGEIKQLEPGDDDED